MNATMAPGPQHLDALAKANKVRLARAKLKRSVHKGEVTVAEVVLDGPWEAKSMSVAELLISQPRWGRARCRKLLQGVPMSETKTVGAMTDRQRKAVASALGRQAAEARAVRPRDHQLEGALA